MIELIMLLAWMLPALAVYRRVGHFLESSVHNGHEFQAICSSCRCKHCGANHGDHFKYRSIAYKKPCSNFEFDWRYLHGRTIFAFPITMLLWPLLLSAYLGLAVKKKMGLELNSFFVPAPVIESKAEKAERLMVEREEDARRRELDIAKKEKELGIV